MKPATQHIHGRLIERNGRYALLLANPNPEEKTADSLYLRFALVTRGREDHIFPAELLDDWGTEMKGLKMYRWIRESGDDFPRAEVFGFDQQGGETQCFLRDLEIYFKLPCYVYSDRQQAIADGAKIEAIILPDGEMNMPQKGKAPTGWQRPLKSAAVNWWHVPSNTTNFDIIFSDKPLDLD